LFHFIPVGIILLSISDPQTFPQCNHITDLNYYYFGRGIIVLVFQPINSDQNIYMEIILDLCEKFFYRILSVSEQIKNFLTAHKHFYFLMANRRNKRIEEQSDSSSSQSDDENYNKNHNKKHVELDIPDVNASKQLLLEKISIFKMIHENKCEDGKSLSSESRIKGLNEIQTLYDKIGHKTSLDQYMIRSTKIRWLTYNEDMEYWELWDKKEEYLNRNSRSREREADKIAALRNDRSHRSRSRSRGRSRSMDNFRGISRDRSRDRYGKYEDERKRKEQVKW